MTRLAFIIDLDYTLVKTNTTFEFLKVICPKRYLILSKILKPLLLLNAIIKRDIYKFTLVMMCIKGWNQRKLKQLARVYYEKIIKGKSSMYFNDILLSFLHRMRNVPKILLTASLDIIAENFKDLSFDIIVSSESYIKDGKLSSFHDLYRRKNLILKILLKYFDKVVVFDDNPEPEFYVLGSKVIVVQIPAYGKYGKRA